MLKDVLENNLDVVFCGTAKGLNSIESGHYYANKNNKFYKALYSAGFTPTLLTPHECYDINFYGIGLTDLVNDEYGSDSQISQESFEVNKFIDKMKLYQPRFIAFNGKRAAAAVFGFGKDTSRINYGRQTSKIHNSVVYVLHSSSYKADKSFTLKYWLELNENIQAKN